MKCPTCGYIGFEAAERCRNCGYDFSLAAPPPSAAADVDLRSGEPEGVLQELDIKAGAVAARRRPASPVAREPDLDKVLGDLDRLIGDPAGSPDLPLFGDQAAGDGPPPLAGAAAAPRRPLSVRRSTPDPARLRSRPERRHGTAPKALELPLPDSTETEPPVPAATAPVVAPGGAPPAQRAGAAAIDFAILAAIDLAVVYFTLRLCGLGAADIGLIPVVPLAAFFLLLNGGYLAAFTAAGGQTIGKMAFGIKVVGRGDQPVSGGLAVVRALGSLASAATLGLGFLPAVLAEGGRAIEDRLADTRVVRVAD